MSLHLAVARRSFRRYSTYTAATMAGIFTNSVFGVINALVLIAVWKQNPDAGGYDVRDAVTYVWIGQAMIMTIALWGLAIALIVIGVAGTVLPALPGIPLVYGGIVLAAWIENFTQISVTTLVVLGVLAAIGFAIDYVAATVSASAARKRFTRSGLSWSILSDVIRLAA